MFKKFGLATVLVALTCAFVLYSGTHDASAQSDFNQQNEGLESVFVTDTDVAKAVFSVSNRNGSDTPDSYAMQWDSVTGVTWTVVFKDEPEYSEFQELKMHNAQSVRSAKRESKPSNQEIAVRVSRYTRSQIDSALTALQAVLETSKVTAGFQYSPIYDAITVDTNSQGALSVPESVEDVAVIVGVGQPQLDISLSGGVGITGPDREYPSSDAICTSGIPAVNRSGTRGIFTAGHCFTLSGNVYANSNWVGRVSHAFTYPDVDAQFISGGSYSGHVFSYGTAKSINGTWFPAAGKGNRLCFTGANSGTICSLTVESYGALFSVDGVTIRNLIRLRGQEHSKGGDSGGAVFANFGSNAKVTGTVTGHDSRPSTGIPITYVTDWKAIQNRYGASLIYGD